MVAAMRARSCSNEVSLSSKRRGSWPASRATEFFAMSHAICTWRVSGNMSGARREASSTPGSNLRLLAFAKPLSRMADRFPSVLENRSTDIACMEIFIQASLAERGWHVCLPGETIASPEREIAAAMNLIWTPAQLSMLAKVIDLNGFSSAARALGVPKAAVSRAVADLEKSLGVKVLERTTRRISLTHAGRLLYPHAKRVVEESEAARAVIGRLHAPISGPLRVVAD